MNSETKINVGAPYDLVIGCACEIRFFVDFEISPQMSSVTKSKICTGGLEAQRSRSIAKLLDGPCRSTGL